MILLHVGYINKPNDEHCIVSSDTDFVQLLADNVTQYNGITQESYTKRYP